MVTYGLGYELAARTQVAISDLMNLDGESEATKKLYGLDAVCDGRHHNQFGFSVWLAGGGVRGGMTYGETDD